MSWATPLSAAIFALHHGREDAFIPLFVLGWTWAVLYLLSGNLFVAMVVHAMWNSAVFIEYLGKL
jgi:membrane protease YdiL (CAAX protease family)